MQPQKQGSLFRLLMVVLVALAAVEVLIQIGLILFAFAAGVVLLVWLDSAVGWLAIGLGALLLLRLIVDLWGVWDIKKQP